MARAVILTERIRERSVDLLILCHCVRLRQEVELCIVHGHGVEAGEWPSSLYIH